MIYIFDMDGTLIDSMPAYSNAISKYLESNNITCEKETIKAVTPLGLGGAAKYFIKNFGCTDSVEKICDILKELVIEDYITKIPAKDGVIEAIKTLKKNGHRLCVLTASPHVTVDPCLKRLGIYDDFEFVWSCEDFDMTKSDVNIYEAAASKLGVTVNDCIFLDDNCNAVATAKRAGMTVYGVYDESSGAYIDEMKEISDKYIISFCELI